MNQKVAILTHATQKFEPVPYLIHPLIRIWESMGIHVFIQRGKNLYQPADALFMHIDLTVTPGDYQSLATRYPVAINGGIVDISKRKISSHIIGRGAGYDGPVIVKTDRNFGGGMEKRLARRSPLSRMADNLSKRLPWYWRNNLKPEHYPVFASPDQVPGAVWWNRKLVVEKFLPERDGRHYALRQWVFLGDREMCQRVVSAQPVVKASNALHRETGLPVPDSLRSLRAGLGFDYGKFDFVMVDGEAVLLDANRTPSFDSSDPTPEQRAMLENLAGGLQTLLSDGKSGRIDGTMPCHR